MAMAGLILPGTGKFLPQENRQKKKKKRMIKMKDCTCPECGAYIDGEGNGHFYWCSYF